MRSLLLGLTACVGFELDAPDLALVPSADALAPDAGPLDFKAFCTVQADEPDPEGALAGQCLTAVDLDVVCDGADASTQTFHRVVILWSRLFQEGASGLGLVETAYRCNEPIRSVFSTPCEAPIYVSAGFQHPTLGGDPYFNLNRGRDGACQGATP